MTVRVKLDFALKTAFAAMINALEVVMKMMPLVALRASISNTTVLAMINFLHKHSR